MDATVNDNYVLDSGTDFIGLGFLDSQPTGTITHSLLILQKVGGTWVIPESSKIKFRVKSPLGHTVTLSIDDGDLTDGYTTQSGDRL